MRIYSLNVGPGRYIDVFFLKSYCSINIREEDKFLFLQQKVTTVDPGYFKADPDPGYFRVNPDPGYFKTDPDPGNCI